MSNYPKWWDGADFTAKAAWLASTGRAKNFSEACSILGKRRRAKPAPRPTPQEYQIRNARMGLD